MKTADFDYTLPPERIAQEPLPVRDASKLLVIDRAADTVSHRTFRDLPGLLSPGDLVVINDTRVVPARTFGVREKTGGRVEVMFLEEVTPTRYRALTHSGGKLTVGERINVADGEVRVTLRERHGEFGDVVDVACDRPLREILEEIGHMPVPPYIHRPKGGAPSDLDRERYQTVYARERGAVAAPTAGLHFTDEVFAALDERGVARTTVTLHVGLGTFKPVKVERVEDHVMDAERYEIPESAARAIAACRARSGRVVAVGPTAVRTLESAARDDRTVEAKRDEARLFITPGFAFRIVDVLVTNFHQPKGTPMMLASAFAGRDRIMRAYREALEREYRFLSYGDSMLIV
jgi:S-adenosylmethionine:tRNA ribosyltransferase-isomerase